MTASSASVTPRGAVQGVYAPRNVTATAAGLFGGMRKICNFVLDKFKNMTIGICNDHAGVDYKKKLVKMLEGKGIEVVNFGTDTKASVDYPDYAHALARAVEAGEVDLGIALCGTGNGMAITLNKHQGIRAGLAWSKPVGELVKAHNNANVLVLPARFISYREASVIVRAWLETTFEGGRHQARIDKIPL